MTWKPESILALDIETSPDPAWTHYEKAALDLNRNCIDLIALHDGDVGICYKSAASLAEHSTIGYVMHGGKFDARTLMAKKAPFRLEQYVHDTMLMAVALSQKVPDSWLESYDIQRKLLNAAAGSKVHRDAGKYSLKTLAPYFLGVEPFWETVSHNDETYALKDARYTFLLAEKLTELLKEEGSWEFYLNHLMPWARLITKAEATGVMVDFELMAIKEAEAQRQVADAEAELKRMWSGAFRAYEQRQVDEVEGEYGLKKIQAVSKLKFPPLKNQALAQARYEAKQSATAARYDELKEKALAKIEPLNLASPMQLTWLLKEQLGLDITTFDEEDESTGKAVLQRLVGEGRSDVAKFLEYRQANKLVTAFFPSYREKAFNGRIHCNFNINGTRTGRLSSSEPNLQQVPADLHALFRAGPGKKIISYDLSNIEPLLIAYITEDYNLCKLYLEEQGNFHDRNVEIMFNIPKCDKKLHKRERDLAKEVGLSILYGAGGGRVDESSARRGFPFGIKKSKAIAKNLRAYYSGVWEYKTLLDERLEAGELVRNIFGRPVVVERDNIYMQGFNTLIQGSGSDLLLESARRAMTRCEEEGLDVTALLFVHDECVFEVVEKDANRADAIIAEELRRWKLSTPYGDIFTSCEGGIKDVWAK